MGVTSLDLWQRISGSRPGLHGLCSIICVFEWKGCRFGGQGPNCAPIIVLVSAYIFDGEYHSYGW
jgi:hypothetical protein